MSGKQRYHVHGHYRALDKDGRLAGEFPFSGEQEAESPEMAIKQAAICAALEHNYRAVMWLYAQAELAERMSRWRSIRFFLVSLLIRRYKRVDRE